MGDHRGDLDYERAEACTDRDGVGAVNPQPDVSR